MTVPSTVANQPAALGDAETTAPGVRLGNRAVDPAQPWLLPVAEPATGRILTQVAGGGEPEAREAADAAVAALPGWSDTPVAARADVLRHIATELRRADVRDELATLITRESGKRLVEAHAEVGLSARYFDWFADAISTRASQAWDIVPGMRHEVAKRPLGVVAVMTPWNFPLSIPARKIAPALAAGCTVVFKPSEVAPLSGLRLAEITEQFILPGVLGSIVGDAETVATTWLRDRRVRGVSFTGSTRVGCLLAGQAASNLTRCTLELGGNAPFIVLDDADLPQAVDLLGVAKYRNNGQSCIAANRVWVPRKLLDDFVAAFAELSNNLKAGDPLDSSTTLGALALPSDPERLDTLLDEAQHAGATVLSSTVKLPSHGQFTPPTICLDAPADARIVADEIFGPVCSIAAYDDIDDVLADTRHNPLGLAGYVVSRDTTRAANIARALDVGIVGINNAAPNTPQIPFPGLKLSGLGAEGGDSGLDAFLTEQSVAIAA